MFLLDWYKAFLQIKREDARERTCENCEYLKIQLEKAQQHNKDLIEKLTTEPKMELQPVPEKVDLKPRHIPWNVRRQLLEGEDRAAAIKLRQAQNEVASAIARGSSGGVQADIKIAPDNDPDVIALEKEMNIIGQERENAGKVG